MASPSALARFTSMRAISAARPLSSRAYAKVAPTLPTPTTATRLGVENEDFSMVAIHHCIVWRGRSCPRIGTLPTTRTAEKRAQVGAVLVIPLCNRESSSTTAGDQEHLHILLGLLRHSRPFFAQYTIYSSHAP